MLGEIIVGLLLVLAVVLAIYLITRKESTAVTQLPPATIRVPMPAVKPTRKEVSPHVYPAPSAQPLPKPVVTRAPTRKQAAYGAPYGRSTQEVDTSATDLLTTVLILDALDTSDNYVPPSVDTYSEPSYSSPTPSSYSSSDDSYNRSSSSSSDYSSSSSDSSSSSSWD